MTIKKLKEMIADLPDEVRVCADDGDRLFNGNEFVVIAHDGEVAVFQTAKDIDSFEETEAMLQYFSDNDYNEVDAWIEISERGYKPEDFADPEWARSQMENYGLI